MIYNTKKTLVILISSANIGQSIQKNNKKTEKITFFV